MPLAAITLAQPWPRMMLLPEAPKRIENRDWPPPRRLIGKHIALHGGRGPKGQADQARLREELDEINLQIWGTEADPEEWEGERILDWCVSGIYAVARLTQVVQRSDDPWFFGPFGWVLEDFVAIDPVPCRGKQGLWKVEGDLLDTVRERWQAARSDAKPAAVSPAGGDCGVPARHITSSPSTPDIPNLRELADPPAGHGRYRMMIPDPMSARQQAALSDYLRQPLRVDKRSGPTVLTDYCAGVLGLPRLPSWRALTVEQAEAVIAATEAGKGQRGAA